MKIKHFIASMILVFLGLAQLNAQNKDWANFTHYAASNAEVTSRPTAVLFGDSITDIWAQQRPEFFKEHNYLGRGISGQTTAQILLRFRKDVLAHHPKYVAILCGVNDIALNDYCLSMENAFNNIVSMCDLAKANKIKPIICTTTPAATIVWRPAVKDGKEQIQRFNQLLRDYARENKIRLVDYAAALANEEGTTDPKYSGDGIHPNAEGYEVMEAMIVKVAK